MNTSIKSNLKALDRLIAAGVFPSSDEKANGVSLYELAHGQFDFEKVESFVFYSDVIRDVDAPELSPEFPYPEAKTRALAARACVRSENLASLGMGTETPMLHRAIIAAYQHNGMFVYAEDQERVAGVLNGRSVREFVRTEYPSLFRAEKSGIGWMMVDNQPVFMETPPVGSQAFTDFCRNFMLTGKKIRVRTLCGLCDEWDDECDCNRHDGR